MTIVLVASEICITLEFQLKNLGHGLHVYRSVVRWELESIKLCVLAVFEEVLEELDMPRTRVVTVS